MILTILTYNRQMYKYLIAFTRIDFQVYNGQIKHFLFLQCIKYLLNLVYFNL